MVDGSLKRGGGDVFLMSWMEGDWVDLRGIGDGMGVFLYLFLGVGWNWGVWVGFLWWVWWYCDCFHYGGLGLVGFLYAVWGWECLVFWLENLICIYGLSVHDSKVLDFCEEEVVLVVRDPPFMVVVKAAIHDLILGKADIVVNQSLNIAILRLVVWHYRWIRGCFSPNLQLTLRT